MAPEWRESGGRGGGSRRAIFLSCGRFQYLLTTCCFVSPPARHTTAGILPCLLSAVFGGRRGHGRQRPAENFLNRTNMEPSSWFSYRANACQLPGCLPAGSAGFFFACPS